MKHIAMLQYRSSAGIVKIACNLGLFVSSVLITMISDSIVSSKYNKHYLDIVTLSTVCIVMDGGANQLHVSMVIHGLGCLTAQLTEASLKCTGQNCRKMETKHSHYCCNT